MESRVKELLENYPTARMDDHELYCKYYVTYFKDEFNMEKFIQHKLNFESISRIRRRIVNMYPELKDNIADISRFRKSISRSLRRVYC